MTRFPLSSKVLLLSLLAVGALLVFAQANAPSLDSDGIHYAAVAKGIAASGRWLLPYDPMVEGPYYFHLHGSVWPTALIFKWLGVSPATAKLYSMGMTLAAAAGLFVLGRILVSGWAGWCAGMAFLLTDHVLRIGRQCRVDLPLAGFIVWAFVGILKAQGAGSRAWYLLAGIASLGAVMTKEMVGLVPLAAAAAYLILRGKWKELLHPLFLAAWAIALVPPAAITWVEQARYHATLWANYRAQNFALLFGAEHLAKPWYYYGWAILDKYWYLLPAALIGARLAWAAVRRGEEPRWLLIFLWAAAFPIGFSLARHKIHYYILPTYAAAALWVGLAAERFLNPGWRKRIVAGSLALAAAGAVALFCLPVQLHKTRYENNIKLAPAIDAIISTRPGELIVSGQDVASLLFYSRAVNRAITAHEEKKFQDLMGASAAGPRYLLIGRRDWERADPAIRLRWSALLDDGERLFLKEETPVRAP